MTVFLDYHRPLCMILNKEGDGDGLSSRRWRGSSIQPCNEDKILFVFRMLYFSQYPRLFSINPLLCQGYGKRPILPPLLSFYLLYKSNSDLSTNFPIIIILHFSEKEKQDCDKIFKGRMDLNLKLLHLKIILTQGMIKI